MKSHSRTSSLRFVIIFYSSFFKNMFFIWEWAPWSIFAFDDLCYNSQKGANTTDIIIIIFFVFRFFLFFF